VLTHKKFQKIFEDLRKEPPTDLMERLANLEARRHQVSVVLFTKPELVFRLLSI
jgi:hypothetical protein